MAAVSLKKKNIADEPTSALDAMTQVEPLNMLATLNRSMGSAILYISHDLQSVASICQRIAILRDGEIVECGDTEGLLLRPRHPYTQRLLACAPWLSWWLDETQRARRQPTRESPSESVAASVCAAPEQLYGRLMSPGQPPMNQ